MKAESAKDDPNEKVKNPIITSFAKQVDNFKEYTVQ